MTEEPSTDELERKARDLLKNANLDLVTSKTIRRSMEDHFQCDLTERKKEIGQLIDRIINESRSDSSSDDEQIIRDLKAQSKKASQHNGSSKQAIKKKDISDKKSDSSEDEVDDEEIARRLQEEEGKRPTRSRGVKKTVPKKKKMTDAPKKKRSTSNNAYMRPLALSPVLAAFTGEPAMPRHEVVKKVWSYVKEHNLFDPKNKQFAICDPILYELVGKKRFRLFGMLKVLTKHFQHDT